MKHALFAAFQYPPDGSSSGVLRTLKHTRYLVDFGWRVTVLAPSVDAYEHLDRDLVAQVPECVKVVRTRYLNSKRHLGVRGRYLALSALPDVWVGWLPFALRAAWRIAADDPFEVVYSTSPPATAHLVARAVARRLGVPWVADFRDPWFEEPPEPGAPSGRVFRAIDRRLERSVVAEASRVVASTGHLRGELVRRHPDIEARTIALANGYDEADFAALPQDAPRVDRFELLHAGSINADFRDPIPLLRAIRRAADAGALDPARVRVRFFGGGAYAGSVALQTEIDTLGLREAVEFVDRVTYAQALAASARASVLLLLQASEDTRGLVPAKLYEYLRLGRPILALVLEGAVSELLGAVGGGRALDPADVPGVAAELGRLYAAWCAGTLDREGADPAAVRRFDRRETARRLAEVFDELVAAPQPARSPR
ncbi:glycosyltransferase [Piscinibacter koreensis]|uniref:Glycosyltransferase n=1 Tax=Piscinibacter koreensis TaxID=2742824 RepID=A0A7Y6TVC8_9BURK|nr:glycosyltransferase [Schlegelella koreensis]NUZ04821.1 glycosyltransferase [Schlegelella koreensis]